MTTTSRLLSTLNDFRKRLAHHETSAEHAINSSYASVLGSIRHRLAVLYQQIEDKQSQGETVPVSWLYEQGRLTNIKAFIASEINRFGNAALLTAQQLQQIGVTLGTQAAQELLHATVPSGVHWTFGRPSSEALRAFIGVSQSGSPLHELFHGFGAEAAKKVGDALLLGLSLGQNPRKVAPQVEQALGISRNRALVISRQELNRCYKSANLESYKQNDDVCSGWIWQAALNARSCAMCIAMSGTKHSLDEEFASHVCCRCAPVPLTKSWDDILGPLGIDTSSIPNTGLSLPSGIDWFESQSEETQKSILGSNAAFSAYQDNAINLKDMIGMTHDADWGTSRYQKSLKDILGNDAKQYYSSAKGSAS